MIAFGFNDAVHLCIEIPIMNLLILFLCILSVSKVSTVNQADTQRLFNHLKTAFSSPRSHLQQDEKELVRRYIRNFFSNIGCGQLMEDLYTVTYGRTQGFDGVNFVYVIKGTDYGKRSDRVTLASAHYDTVRDSPGVNDDGSAMAVLLESARSMCMLEKCERKKTTIIVAFDWEEQGLIGSEQFIDRFLAPRILIPAEISEDQIEGIINMDNVMNWDSREYSQNTPDGFNVLFPNIDSYLKHNNYTGDFLMISGRHEDENLADGFTQLWNSLPLHGSHNVQFGLLPFSGRPSDLSKMELNMLIDLMRSDHYNFWNYQGNYTSSGLKGIFLTDTADFRGSMSKCYHQSCDDLSLITDDKMVFLGKLTETLSRFLIQQATGEDHFLCVGPAETWKSPDRTIYEFVTSPSLSGSSHNHQDSSMAIQLFLTLLTLFIIAA